METLREKSSSHLILLHPLGVQPGPFRWVSVSIIYRWCWTEKMFIVLELWLQALLQCLRGSFRKRSSFLVCLLCMFILTPAISKRRQGTSKAQGRDFESCKGRSPPDQPRDHIGHHWENCDCFVISLHPLQCELSWIGVPKGDFIHIGQGKKKVFSSVVPLVLWEPLKMPICKERFCNLSTHHFIRSVSQPIHQSNNEPNKQRR